MKLKFAGETDSQGRPLEYYEGVPARDLDEQEVKALKEANPDLFKALTRERKTAGGARPALYREVGAKTVATSSSARKRPSRAKPTPAPATEPVAAPTPHDEPAESVPAEEPDR